MNAPWPITTPPVRDQRCLRLPSWSLTAALVLVIGAVFCSPPATAWAEFDRHAVAGGQWWRIATSNFAHWNGENLFWNLIVFAVLGAVCEARDRLRFAVVVLVSALATGLAVLLFEPQVSSCRGISGVDSALFALLAVTVLRAHLSDRNWRWVAAVGILVAGFAAKIMVELATGRAVFVDSSAAGFAPIPLAHTVGAAVGTLAAIIHPRSPRPRGGSRAAGPAGSPRPCTPCAPSS